MNGNDILRIITQDQSHAIDFLRIVNINIDYIVYEPSTFLIKELMNIVNHVLSWPFLDKIFRVHLNPRHNDLVGFLDIVTGFVYVKKPLFATVMENSHSAVSFWQVSPLKAMYVFTRGKMLGLVLLIVSSWGLALYAFVYYRWGASGPSLISTRRSDSPYQIIEIQPGVLKLPSPVTAGTMSVEEAIFRRRSRREYLDKPLDGFQLSQLLWASQGITEPKSGLRVTPSAGGTYPLEVYAIVGENCVNDIRAGIYRYSPKDHTIILVASGDFRTELSAAALNQEWVAKARVNFVVTAIYERTTQVYGSRGIRYVNMEAGHVGQNVYLIATAMGLGGVVIGAFHDEHVQSVLRLPKDQVPLYVIPVGYPKE